MSRELQSIGGLRAWNELERGVNTICPWRHLQLTKPGSGFAIITTAEAIMTVAPEAVTETSRDHHTRLALIRSLLCEYRVTGDVELAEFVENYTRALELDLAAATAAGKVTALQHISEDVSALLADTQLRVWHERSRRTHPH